MHKVFTLSIFFSIIHIFSNMFKTFYFLHLHKSFTVFIFLFAFTNLFLFTLSQKYKTNKNIFYLFCTHLINIFVEVVVYEICYYN